MDLMFCVVYKFQCGKCNTSFYGETDRHLKVRSGEHIGISPSFDDFTILAQATNKFLLEIKESFLIKRDKPI